ncbi:MAG: hypothetical protein ACRDSN_18305, partial [Pseudonocardiaceae bacterium]
MNDHLVDQMILTIAMEAPEKRGAGRASLGDVEADHPPKLLVQSDLVADVVSVPRGPEAGAERDVAEAR